MAINTQMYKEKARKHKAFVSAFELNMKIEGVLQGQTKIERFQSDDNIKDVSLDRKQSEDSYF